MRGKLLEWCLIIGQTDCLEGQLDSIPPPWEAVAEGMQKALFEGDAHTTTASDNLVAWPDGKLSIVDISERFSIPEGVEIGDREFLVIDSIAEKYNAELRYLAETWRKDMVDAVRSRWHSGAFDRGPLFLPPYRGADSIHTITVTHDQWCVAMVLRREEYPWLVDQIAAMNGLKKARNEEIQSYLNLLN